MFRVTEGSIGRFNKVLSICYVKWLSQDETHCICAIGCVLLTCGTLLPVHLHVKMFAPAAFA